MEQIRIGSGGPIKLTELLRRSTREFVPPKPPQALGGERITSLFGLDLGKLRDFTALGMIDVHEKPNELKWYGCRAMKRWPIGTTYPDIVANVKEILERDQWRDSILVIDATGVGLPVVDYIRKARVNAKVVAVTITGGQDPKEQTFDTFRVPKQSLITNAQVLLQSGRLKIAKGLDVLVKELGNYQVRIKPSGTQAFDARDGEHDDTVLALAIALWWAEHKRRHVNMR